MHFPLNGIEHYGRSFGTNASSFGGFRVEFSAYTLGTLSEDVRGFLSGNTAENFAIILTFRALCSLLSYSIKILSDESIIKQKVLGRTNLLLSLIRHGSQR
jgi:hypothetical protein